MLIGKEQDFQGEVFFVVAVLEDGLGGLGEAHVLEDYVITLNMDRLLLHHMVTEHIQRIHIVVL